MPSMPIHLFVAPFFGAAFVLGGCDAAPPPGAPPVERSPAIERSQPAQSENQTELRRKQIAFLNRIREADPQGITIERALLNEQNELGLVLDRTVEMDKIPALMRTMLGQMAKQFPGQDLAIIAYTPSNPPRKIGTARLDASTRDMTYKPEK